MECFGVHSSSMTARKRKVVVDFDDDDNDEFESTGLLCSRVACLSLVRWCAGV